MLLQLYIEFFKIGLFSIGGGLATIPFIKELMEKTHWFTMSDVSNMIAVSECTPGPMGVNMATYVGNVIAGFAGGIIATLGLISPSIIVIIIVAHFLKKFKDSPAVQGMMLGLRPASTGLIIVATVSVALAAIFNQEAYAASGTIIDFFNFKAMGLAAILFIMMRKLKWHPVAFIGIAAVVGVMFKF